MGKIKQTCHGCEHLRHSALGMVPLAYCGATEKGLIVPHTADKDTITYTRVPMFCTQDDRFKSETTAPEKEWDVCESISIIQTACD